MGKKYTPPPQSLENLKLGSLARKKNKVKLNLTVDSEIAASLKRSGNASRFVELMFEAYKLGRTLTPQEILEGALLPDDHQT
jgi:hypothetical protein